METIIDIIPLLAIIGLFIYMSDKMKEIDYIYKYIRKKENEEKQSNKENL